MVNVYDEVASEAEAAEVRSPAAESADAKARNKESACYLDVPEGEEGYEIELKILAPLCFALMTRSPSGDV